MQLSYHGSSNPITRYEAKFRTMFEEDIACTLLRIDSNTIVGDDSAGLRRHFELFGSEFENGGERCCLWNAKHFEGKLWIGGESHFEGDLSTTNTTQPSTTKSQTKTNPQSPLANPTHSKPNPANPQSPPSNITHPPATTVNPNPKSTHH